MADSAATYGRDAPQRAKMGFVHSSPLASRSTLRATASLLMLGGLGLTAACGTRVEGPPPAPISPGRASGGSSGASGAAHNPASDIGVTATTITVGNLVSRTSPLGPEAFSGS